jgi:hypothetical protein
MAGGKPIPKSKFALPNANGGSGAYPLDTVKRARNALSRIAQHGTPEQKAKVKKAVQRRYSGQINVGGVQNHANAYDFADGGMKCPNCGHTGSADEFTHNDSDYDNDSARSSGSSQPGVLRTPQPSLTGSRSGLPLTVRGSSKTLANSGRAIGLARRMPIREMNDIVISRNADGSAVVRHRQGGNEVGLMKPNEDGTYTPVVNGKGLSPHRQQRAALLEMFGTYNRDAAANPLQPAPVQTPLMQTFGVPAIRLASDSSDDTDNDDSASSDTSSDSNGLTPRGQGIYKKLVSKGVKPAVAMAMAKRAQNTSAGSFGNAKAS